MNEETSMPGRMEIQRPFNQAIERARVMMFERGDAAKWFQLGLIIFLARLVKTGGGGSASGSHGSGGDMQSISEGIVAAKEWFYAHITIVVMGAALITLVVAAISLVVAWLGSRGQLMFVRAVALDDASIGDNWRETRHNYLSLFLFRILLFLAGFVLFIGGAAALVPLIVGLAEAGENSFWAYLAAAAPIIAGLMVVGFAFLVFDLILTQFVVPLMYQGGCSCREGWGRFFAMARNNIGPIILFFLARFLYSIVCGIGIVIISVCTCCIGFLPYIHQVLFSPYFVFDRAFAMYALQSIGPEYTFFQPEPEYIEETPPPLPDGQ